MRLVYCHGRSGSTQLVRAARKEPGASTFYDEPFKQVNAKIHGYKSVVKDGENLEDYINFLNPVRVKHLWTDLSKDLNERLIANKNVRSILFLYRRGVVDYTMSMVTARLTKEWHGASSGFFGEMPIDRVLKTAHDIVREIPENAQSVASNAIAPVSCVAYEDLYGTNGDAMQRDAATSAFSALGISDEGLINQLIDSMLSDSKKYKTHDYYRSIFENYDEVMKSLEEFENYFVSHPELLPENILKSKTTR